MFWAFWKRTTLVVPQNSARLFRTHVVVKVDFGVSRRGGCALHESDSLIVVSGASNIANQYMRVSPYASTEDSLCPEFQLCKFAPHLGKLVHRLERYPRRLFKDLSGLFDVGLVPGFARFRVLGSSFLVKFRKVDV